ncbi:MAG TPA: hypothetical protein DCP28_37735 [Cytophagales bacterium]|nr:hypothetical protein [Cytophagales bacterium]
MVRRGKRVRVTAVILALALISAAVLAWNALQGRSEAEEAYTQAAAERDEAEAGRQQAMAETEEVRRQMALAAAQGFEAQGNQAAVELATMRADSLGELIALLQEQIELETQRADDNAELAASAQARVAVLDSLTQVYGVQLAESAEQRAVALAEARRLKAVTDAEILANQGYQLLRRNQVQRGKDLVLAAYDTNRVHDGPEFNAAIFQALTEAYVSTSRPSTYEAKFYLTEWPSASFHESSQKLAVSASYDQVRVSTSLDPLTFSDPISLGEPVIGLAWSKDGKYLFAGGRKYLYRIEVAIGEVRTLRLRGMGRRGVFYMQPVEVEGTEYVMYATDYNVGIVPMVEFGNEEDAAVVFTTPDFEYIRQLQLGPEGDIWLITDFTMMELSWNTRGSETNLRKGKQVVLRDLIGTNEEMFLEALAVSSTEVALGTTSGDVFLIPKDEITLRGNERLSIYRHSLHRDGITHLEFDKAGTRLLSSSFDHTSKLVLMEEGKIRLQEVNLDHKKSVWWGGFCNDYIVTLNGEESVRRWLTKPEELVASMK